MYLPRRGMTLIDVLVGTAIAAFVFLGLLGILRASAIISGAAAAKAAALAIANGKLEQLRSLPYASIGTVGGIPAGSVPQETEVASDGVTYAVRTFIAYYDDPMDGTGSADSNGIVADYKRAKITVSYYTQNGEREVAVVSNFAPPSLETLVGGGTLRVVVVDADGAAVPGAEVSVENASVSPAIDLTTFTDFAGYALLPGAATSTGYQVTVTKDGWSTAKTYSQTAENQNPAPGHLTIAGGQTTTGTFAIDELASVLVRTFTPVVPMLFTDTFADASNLSASSGTTAAAGVLALSSGTDGYESSGTATSVELAPSYLAAWHEASFTPSTPAGTTLEVHVLDGAGMPVPDAVLPGNAAGFSASPISLAGLSPAAYPSLALRAELSTSATSTTPTLADWNVAYSRGPVPLASVPFTLTGAKTVGSTVSGTPVFKTALATSTDAAGMNALSLEWDSYALSVPSYVLVDSCIPAPFEVLPGASTTASLILATSTGTALRVYAKDANGASVAGASITVTGGSVNRTLPGNACGFAYFGGMPSGTYAVAAAAPGLSSSDSGISVSGLTSFDAILH